MKWVKLKKGRVWHAAHRVPSRWRLHCNVWYTSGVKQVLDEKPDDRICKKCATTLMRTEAPPFSHGDVVRVSWLDNDLFYVFNNSGSMMNIATGGRSGCIIVSRNLISEIVDYGLSMAKAVEKYRVGELPPDKGRRSFGTVDHDRARRKARHIRRARLRKSRRHQVLD